MKSLEARLESLERAAEQATAEETIIQVQLICCSTRAELSALNEYEAEHPEPPRPPAPGRIRLVQVPTVTGGEILRRHGIVWPPETIETKGSEGT
jgi:hypothetical protein